MLSNNISAHPKYKKEKELTTIQSEMTTFTSVLLSTSKMSQPTQNPAPKLTTQTTRTNFISLPRELRQQILSHALCSYIATQGIKNILKIRSIREATSDWLTEMKCVHYEVGIDAEYVADKMREKYSKLEERAMVNIITGALWGPVQLGLGRLGDGYY